MTDFFKATDFESLNLSDISDVDPDEIEKIVKSAGEVDRKYIGDDPKVHSKPPKFLEDELYQFSSGKPKDEPRPKLSILSKEETSNNLSKNIVPPTEFSSMTSQETDKKYEKKPRGTADWLGLKDLPETNNSIINPEGSYLGLDFTSQNEGRNEMFGSLTRKGGSMEPSSGRLNSASSKGRLLDELFGESKLLTMDSFKADQVGENVAGVSDGGYKPSTEGPYLPSGPSNVAPRRPVSARPFEPVRRKPEEDLKQRESVTAESNIGQVTRKVTDTGPVDKKELPDWLGGSPGKALGAKTVEERGSEEILEDEKDEKGEELKVQSEEKTTRRKTGTINSATEGRGDEKTIVSLLTKVQEELGSAMMKRNEDFQNYMKALKFEAERLLGDNINSPSMKEGDTVKNEASVDKNKEIIRQQEEKINSFQVNLNELELQKNRLQLEIENMKCTHEMEIETLQKNHSYELSSLEGRMERLKASFREVEEEFQGKISKMKENESSLVNEYKERLERAESQRLSELEKLGELHQAALQQAVALNLSVPSLGKVLRIPLVAAGRPKDEVELSDRESTLLEKEKQLEVERSVLDAESEEVAGVRLLQEERERELRRKEKEAKLREDARRAEGTREREQLDALALQIKLMRDEAVREQGEIAKEKLELAAERARLEAIYSIQGRADTSIPPLDILQARVEVEAALETAKEAKEAAERERRKHAEQRQTIEQISWEQKEADLRLESREKYLIKMLQNAEKIREEGFSALEESKRIKSLLDEREKDLEDRMRTLDAQEKILSKERLDIAREKIELERKRSHLDIFLPDLMGSEVLPLNVPPKVFVDPKAVILRLKAEKEFEASNIRT